MTKSACDRFAAYSRKKVLTGKRAPGDHPAHSRIRSQFRWGKEF
jgi:hypothetical protein